MHIPNKFQALLYLILAAVGLILLGISLPGLQLQPALPVPGAFSTAAPGALAVEGRPPAVEVHLPQIVQGTLALGFILAVAAFVINIMKKASLKRIGLLGAGLLVLFVLFNLLPRLAPAAPNTFPGDTPGTPLPAGDFAVAPIGDPPAGLLRLVLVLLLAVAAVVFIWLLRRAFQPRPREDALEREVEAAIRAIAGGQDLRGVIIRCYLNMEAVVREERGVVRSEGVTPREFETTLVARGIPRLPLQQLVRIFEKARYSDQEPEPEDEQNALNCLSAIRAACAPARRGAR